MESDSLIYTNLYNSIPLSSGGICDLFLTNRIWQMWWVVFFKITLVITLYWIRLLLSALHLEAWGSKWPGWRSPHGKTPGGRLHNLLVASSPRPKRNQVPNSLNTRKWILPTTWMNVEMDSFSVKPSDENTAQATSRLQSWDSEQRTQLSQDQTHDPQKLWDNKCVCCSKHLHLW